MGKEKWGDFDYYFPKPGAIVTRDYDVKVTTSGGGKAQDADKKDPYAKEGRAYEENGLADGLAELTNIAASPLGDAGAVFGGTGGYIEAHNERAAGGLGSTATAMDTAMSSVQGFTG